MRTPCDRGQAAFEFPLIIPLVVVALLAVVQVTVVAYSQVMVTHTAREIARSLSADPDREIHTILDEYAGPGQNGLDIQVQFETGGVSGSETVVVSVEHQVSPVFIVFKPFSDTLQTHAEVKMMLES